MNKISIPALILSLVVALPLAAQNDEDKVKKDKRVVIIRKGPGDSTATRDTIEIRMENIEIDSEVIRGPLVIPGIISSANLNLGFGNVNAQKLPPLPQLPFLYSPFPELNTGKSLHVGLENNWGFNLIKGKLRLWTGLRYDINSYRFSDPDTRLSPGSKYFNTSLDSMANSVKSKVVVNYLGIPIALGYQSDSRDAEEGFFIRAGVTAGYRVRTHSKVKLENSSKDKVFDDFSFNNFAVSPFLLVGYNSIGIYARYTTTPLFSESQGPEANAFQFGLLMQ